MMDDNEVDETGPRLMRQDVPISMVHEMNGHHRRKNAVRSVVGRTNCRSASSSMILSGTSNNGAPFAQDQNSFYQDRASSSMSQRKFMNSTLNGYGSERSFSPNQSNYSHRSITPQSFWYGGANMGTQSPPLDAKKKPGIYTSSDAVRDGTINRTKTATPGLKPKLLNPTEIIRALKNTEDDIHNGKVKRTATSMVAQGIAGAIPAADGSTIDSLPPQRETECEVPRSHSVPLEFQVASRPQGRVSSVTKNHIDRRPDSQLSTKSNDQALMRFFRSTSGIDGENRKLPGTLPTIVHDKPHTRVELTKFPSTRETVQAATNAGGAFMDERSRFDGASRGLSYPAHMQKQKLLEQAHFEVRAKRRNDNFDRVSSQCTAYDQRLEKKKESRILHKAEVMRTLKRQLEAADKGRQTDSGATMTMER